MQLLLGPPENTADREEKEIRTYELLSKLGIEFYCVDHEKADTMEVCKEIDKVLEVSICKNLFLCNRQKTSFYLLMMPGDKKFLTKELSSQINSARLSFCGEEFMQEFLDIKPGSVSVMGLMNDIENNVQLIIDEDVLKDEWVGCHPCVNTSSLKIRTKDIIEKFLPAVKHNYLIVKLRGE